MARPLDQLVRPGLEALLMKIRLILGDYPALDREKGPAQSAKRESWVARIGTLVIALCCVIALVAEDPLALERPRKLGVVELPIKSESSLVRLFERIYISEFAPKKEDSVSKSNVISLLRIHRLSWRMEHMLTLRVNNESRARQDFWGAFKLSGVSSESGHLRPLMNEVGWALTTIENVRLLDKPTICEIGDPFVGSLLPNICSQLLRSVFVSANNELPGGPPKFPREYRQRSGNEKQEEGGHGKRDGAPSEPPIKRRFFVMLVFFVGSIVCALFAGDALYEQRGARCAALVGCGIACGLAGFSVLLLTAYPYTWGWWI